VVRRLQDLRKEAGLRVEDRIRVRYSGAEQIEAAIAAFADTITRETLGVSLEGSTDSLQHAWRGEIDTFELVLSLERVEA
jgi:hypothetical protein